MSLNIIINKIQNSTKNLHSPVLTKKDKIAKRLYFLMRLTEQNIGLSKLNYKSKLEKNPAFFKKGNPFIFIRKNYKKLFSKILQKSHLTPNLLKLLHMAYFPKNDYVPWRMFYIYHGLELKLRKNLKQPIIPKLTYLFSLIFKKSTIKYFLDFMDSKGKKAKYFNRLLYLYHLNLTKIKQKFSLKYLKARKVKILKSKLKKKHKQLFLDSLSHINPLYKFKYFRIPAFIIKKRIKREFKNFFLLTFKQRSFLKNLINFYFPVLSLDIQEINIHSLPMKTKKPRRV